MESANCQILSALPQPSEKPTDVRERCLSRAVENAVHLLPAQGPIGVFVHHNTLHALEHLSFHDAVQYAASLYGCEPYLTKERYGDEYARGRIRERDLVSVIREDLADAANETVGLPTTRFDLRLAMVRFPIPTAPSVEPNYSHLKWEFV